MKISYLLYNHKEILVLQGTNRAYYFGGRVFHGGKDDKEFGGSKICSCILCPAR
jgi:hypothetical protein